MNMVTKDAGNRWRGNMRYSFANEDLQRDNHRASSCSGFPTFRRQPDARDLRLQRLGRRRDRAGPAVGQRRLPAVERRQADQRAQPRRHAGARRQQAEELLGQGAWQSTSAHQKLIAVVPLQRQDPRPSPRPAAELRPGHGVARADQPGAVDAGASTPASASALVFESGVQRDGRRRPTTAIRTARRRRASASRTTAAEQRIVAAPRHEEQPNSRHAVRQRRLATTPAARRRSHAQGRRAVRAAVLRSTVHGPRRHHYVLFNDGVPNSRAACATRRRHPRTSARVLGFFVQDSWSLGSRLTLNLGMPLRPLQRHGCPAQSNPAADVHRRRAASMGAERHRSEDRRVAAGVVYDLPATAGRRSRRATAGTRCRSGIDRVTTREPVPVGNGTCPWNDRQQRRQFQAAEITGAVLRVQRRRHHVLREPTASTGRTRTR